MKTYLHIKSGNRYPQAGVASWFTTFSKGKLQHHIKPGYPQCTMGWKNVNLKQWKEEEIPDLAKPFTRQQWIEYADKFGDMCAMQFLDTCDYSKPSAAFQMRNPPKNKDKWTENDAWFKSTFKRSIWDFTDGTSMAFGNTYAINILRFEKHLASEFGYEMDKEGSMKDFIEAHFDTATLNKFTEIFFTNLI